MNLRKQLSSYIALNNYVEAFRENTSSIVLTDAITNGLTDLQLKGSEVKNKPEMFLDSVVAKGGTEQRNLPAEYTQVNYVTNTVSTAVDTGVMIDFAKNYEFEVECSAATGSWYILQSRETTSSPITGISGSMNGNTISLVVGGISPCVSAITRTAGNKLYVKATLNNGVATLYVKDKTAGTEDTQTGSYDTSQTNPTAVVYFLGNAAGQYVGVNSDVYMARIKENDTVVMDYVPAKQDATAGFYDKASGTFKTALTPENLSAGPEVVPTPDTPMDIVSNNGVVKVRHQSGLPLGYTLLDYVESTGTQYIDTEIANWNNTLEYEIKLSIEPQTGVKTYFGCYDEWSTSENNVPNISTWTNYKVASNFRAGYSSGSGTDIGIITGQTGTISLKGNTISWSEGSSTSFDRGYDFTVPFSIFLFAQHAKTAATEFATTKIYRAKFWLNGELIRDFRPMLDYNNVACMFDMVTGKCFYNQGTGEFVAGSPVSDPVEIYTDGTVETIESHGKNLFNKNGTLTNGYYQSIDGAWVANAVFRTQDYIKASPNTDYTLSVTNLKSGGNGMVMSAWDSEHNWLGSISSTTTGVAGTSTKLTGTTPPNTFYLSVSFAIAFRDINTLQIEKGSTATEYEPYFDGGTATSEMLLKVGDYQDEQEILSGNVTRKIGVKVLDGTEDWRTAYSGFYSTAFSNYIASAPAYCNYFQSVITGTIPPAGERENKVWLGSSWLGLGATTRFPTVAEFKQWLANQYAAGTPVIVVYPLANTVKETVESRDVFITSGTNTIERSSEYVSSDGITVKYKKLR